MNKGKFENKLVRIEYTSNSENKVVKFTISANFKGLKYCGKIGIYKKQVVNYGSEYYDQDKNILSFSEVPKEYTCKESNFNHLIECLQVISMIPYCNNQGIVFSSVKIENEDYIKDPHRAAFLYSDYAELLSNDIKEKYKLELLKQEEQRKQDKINSDHREALEINYFQDLIKESEYLTQLYNNKDITIDYVNYSYKGINLFSEISSKDISIKEIISRVKFQELKNNIREYLRINLKNCRFIEYNFNPENKFIRVETDKKYLNEIKELTIPKFKYFEISIQCRTKRPYFDTFTFDNYILTENSIKDIKEITSENNNIIVCSVPQYESKEVPKVIYEVPKVNEPLQVENHNKGKKYTKEDDEKLEFLYKAGKSFSDLSEIFGRSEQSIKTRLQMLNLIDNKGTWIEPGAKTEQIKEEIKELPKETENTIKEYLLPVLYKQIKESENNIKDLNKELETVVSLKKTVKIAFQELNKGYILITGNTYPIKETIKKFSARFYKNFKFNGNVFTGWIIKENSLDLLKSELNKG